jgi:hypothetical protein
MAAIERELAALIQYSQHLKVDARELAKRAEVVRRKAQQTVALIAKTLKKKTLG